MNLPYISVSVYMYVQENHWEKKKKKSIDKFAIDMKKKK